MTEPLDETAGGTIDFSAIERVLELNADVIAVGPGLGQSPGTAAFVHALLERTGVPLVLDADALNAFAGDPDRLMGRDEVDVVITPHPGEMARLLNMSIEAVQHDRLKYAREFAAAHRVHVVLKGHRTVIAAPDGRTFVNLTGNAGMLVAMVTVALRPACATISASCPWYFAFRTTCLMPRSFSSFDRRSDFSIETVPTSAGRPFCCCSMMSPTMASYFSFSVR